MQHVIAFEHHSLKIRRPRVFVHLTYYIYIIIYIYDIYLYIFLTPVEKFLTPPFGLPTVTGHR